MSPSAHRKSRIGLIGGASFGPAHLRLTSISVCITRVGEDARTSRAQCYAKTQRPRLQRVQGSSGHLHPGWRRLVRGMPVGRCEVEAVTHARRLTLCPSMRARALIGGPLAVGLNPEPGLARPAHLGGLACTAPLALSLVPRYSDCES
jgi:hypothetical protein